MKEVDKLIVAVGSAEHSNEKRNPFSGAERVRMLQEYLKEKGIPARKVRVVAVNDASSYSEAISNMFKACGNVDVVFLKKKDAPLARMVRDRVLVRQLPYMERLGGISSTKIRNAIARGRKWEHMTGRSVARLIGRSRVRRIKESYK